MNKGTVSFFAKVAALALVAGVSASAVAAAPKGSVGAYVWAGDMTGKNAPAAGYSYNAVGKANTVKKTGTGVYEVKLEGVATPGGHAVVQSYGPGAGYCKAVRWNAAGADQMVNVACFNGAGAPTDSQFTVAFFM